ncbi:hypothetical protein [Pseudomonas fragi]|uniref:hypothetical protein n=1 Tax=Pseudomonas fragi TaxID=296 RepID=UPI00113FEF56|nr:hypothetical protein [Pseudomonas fragi]
MKNLKILPKGYSPYKLLNVCSNKLVDGANIVVVGDIVPLLIGRGSKPQVWLRALQGPQSKKFISLVEASISQHPLVRVEEVGRQLVVKVQGATVLRVEQTSEDQAFVSELDLTKLGLNVFGSISHLNAGGVTFSNNTFSGGGALVAFPGKTFK